MLGPSEFRDLVSGRSRGLRASAWRGAFALAAVPYGLAVRLRNWRYDRGLAAVHSAKAPVVSVGNLTLGGTGKTPLVEWVVQQLRAEGRRPAIVSRGYGSTAEQPNDEALELALALPDVPHLQNPNRVAAARAAVESHNADCLVLDDGFQHRRLSRDLDIVLLDATEPFGFEHIFPRGTLRESITGLARAQVILLSRSDMLDRALRAEIRARALRLAPAAVWCEVQHRPVGLLNTEGLRLPLSELHEKRAVAFCGIGNPQGFRFTLDSMGLSIEEWKEFADHHEYRPEDVEALGAWAAEADVALCTRKDLVKLPLTRVGRTPLWALEIGIEFLDGQAELEKLLTTLPRANVQ